MLSTRAFVWPAMKMAILPRVTSTMMALYMRMKVLQMIFCYSVLCSLLSSYRTLARISDLLKMRHERIWNCRDR